MSLVDFSTTGVFLIPPGPAGCGAGESWRRKEGSPERVKSIINMLDNITINKTDIDQINVI